MADRDELAKKFNVVAAVTEAMPEPDSKPWLATFVAKALKSEPHRAKHRLFGEPHVNGNMLETYQMMAENYEIFEAAAAAGIKHLALEFPAGLQQPLDAYARKEIT